MFIKALLKKVALLCLALSCVTTLVACGIGADTGEEDADNAPTLTQTLEPTLPPTSSPTPTETPTPTPTLEPTPIVEGDIEILTENMEEGDIVWSMFELQKIVNAYDQGSEVSFSEYIAEAKESISNEGSYQNVYRAVEKLEEFGKLDTMSLIYTLKDVFPELIFPDIPAGMNLIIDIFPEEVRQKMIEYSTKLQQGEVLGKDFVYCGDARAAFSPGFDYEVEDFFKASIILDGPNYDDGFPDFINTVIIISEFEENSSVPPKAVRVNKEGKLILVSLSNKEASEIFTGGYEVLWLSDNAMLDGLGISN